MTGVVSMSTALLSGFNHYYNQKVIINDITGISSAGHM